MGSLWKYKIKSIFSRAKRTRNPAEKHRASYDKSADVSVKKIKVSKNKLAAIGVTFLAIAILYYFVPIVYNLIALDFSKGIGDLSVTTQDLSPSRVNFVLIGVDEYNNEYRFIDSIILLTYDFDTKQLGVFPINPDIKANIPGLNKQVELRRFMNFLPVKGKETDYLMSTLSSMLAVKIDRYVYMNTQSSYEILKAFPDITVRLNRDLKDPDTVNLPTGDATDLRKGQQVINNNDIINIIASDANGKDDQLDRQASTISAIFKSTKSVKLLIDFNEFWVGLTKGIRTNFTKLEILRLGYEFTGLRDDTIKKAYTRSSSYFRLPSTTIYGSFMVFTDRLDKDISSIFFNVDVFKEHAKIEIFNGTGIRGLAGNRSRWVTNIGGNVVKIGNAESSFDKVYFYVENPEEFKNTITELKKIFPVEVVQVNGKYYSRQIGDLVIVIGANYQ